MLWHGKNFRGIINKAKEMIFDNTGTDLISTNAEDAIKEVNSNLTTLLTSIGILTEVKQSGNVIQFDFDNGTDTFVLQVNTLSDPGSGQRILMYKTTGGSSVLLWNI